MEMSIFLSIYFFDCLKPDIRDEKVIVDSSGVIRSKKQYDEQSETVSSFPGKVGQKKCNKITARRWCSLQNVENIVLCFKTNDILLGFFYLARFRTRLTDLDF